MPMIDIYATAGTFRDPHTLATSAATTLKRIEEVPDIPMFRDTAAFIHDLPPGTMSDVDGGGEVLSAFQVLTNASALDRRAARRRGAADGAHRGCSRRCHDDAAELGPPDPRRPRAGGVYGATPTRMRSWWRRLVRRSRTFGQADDHRDRRWAGLSTPHTSICQERANTSSPSTASIARATSRRLACERGPCGDERGRGGRRCPTDGRKRRGLPGRWAITFTTVPSGPWTKRRGPPRLVGERTEDEHLAAVPRRRPNRRHPPRR